MQSEPSSGGGRCFQDEDASISERRERTEPGFAAAPYGGESIAEEEEAVEPTGGIQAFVADDEVVEAVNVEVILTEEEEELIARQKQRRVVAIVVGFFVLVAAIVVPVSLTSYNNSGPTTPAPTAFPTEQPSASPSSAPTDSTEKKIAECLADITSKETFGQRGSGQWKALQWLVSEDEWSQDFDCAETRYRERYALTAMFLVMNGQDWLDCGISDPICARNRNQYGWMNPKYDHCLWNQVRCEDNNVIGINLGSQFSNQRSINRLVGTFPSEMRILTSLVQINLKEAGTTGQIPDFFAALTNLEELSLWNNGMTGTLPEIFTGDTFPRLRNFILTGNQIKGTIPSSHGTLTSIREYRVADNQLSGSIPPELVNMQLIAYLDLGNNALNGASPPGLFDRTELRILSLHDNRVSGVLPDDIGKLTYLERLRLHNTNFGGKIPKSLFTIPRLQEVRLRSCRFEGEIDDSILNATYLQIFDVGVNPISGTVPAFGYTPEFLEELKLDFTDVTGSITQELCNSTGQDFGELEFLWVPCSVSRPRDDCGSCYISPTRD